MPSLELLHDYGALPLLAASPDGQWLVIEESQSQQVIYNLVTSERLPLPALPKDEFRVRHGFTADGAYLIALEYSAMGEYRHFVRYSFPQGERIGFVPMPAAGAMQEMRWLTDGALMVQDSNRVLLFDMAANQLKDSLNFSYPVFKSAFAPDASMVAVFAASSGADFREPGYQETEQWLEVRTFPAGQQCFKFEVPKSHRVRSLSFSPDSSLLAIFKDKLVLVYETTKGKERGYVSVKVTNTYYLHTQFLSDGTLLVSDGEVKVYAVK